MDQHPKSKTLPLVIPLVMYHGTSAQKAITLDDLVEPSAPELRVYIPDFALEFTDFSPARDLEIKGQILTQLFLICLRAKNKPKDAAYFRIVFELLNQLDDSQTSIEWMRLMISYMQQVMDVDKGVIIEMGKQYLSTAKEDTLMTVGVEYAS